MFSSTSTQTGRISIHALREEGDLDPSQSLRGVRISIHALREEGDLPEKDRQAVRSISIHALREEGDRHPAERRAGLLRISIHALREEGDGKISSIEGEPDNFYPRPPRGGRLVGSDGNVQFSCISIHALREEGDGGVAAVFRSFACISIHALREEGDREKMQQAREAFEFLSTPSARRATTTCSSSSVTAANFYPRPPRGGRPRYAARIAGSTKFLSTPSARRATFQPDHAHGSHKFLSTPSARRATWPSPSKEVKINISIHALREEGDLHGLLRFSKSGHISIHALREEGDSGKADNLADAENFYPRPPRGGRRISGNRADKDMGISIHALREEGDALRFAAMPVIRRFLSTPSARRATCAQCRRGSV